MKRIILSAFIVLALISIDLTISMAYANSNITIYKVTKVSTRNKLQLRAWPSPKSRIKVSLPYNAKDLTDTGKKKKLGKTTWLEVKWKNNQGWVNARYLKKTGVLPGRRVSKTNKVASSPSRNTKINNTKAVVKVVKKKATPKRVVAKHATKPAKQTQKISRSSSINEIPPMPTENRYSQPSQVEAREIKTSYAASVQPSESGKILGCVGSSPSPWSITMDVANKKMRVKSKGQSAFYLPIKYHEWASPSKVRMNMGGSKGRNIVDVNLEKTDACSTGLSRKNYMYEVNATINRDFYSGCCETITH